MDKLQEQYFATLTTDRAEGAKALEGFALRGVKNSVVEKYSDQAHFIYELLQNADDAKATSARFVLFPDRLVFAHNGTRRFTVSDPANEAFDLESGTLGDINAITAVGGSNKTDEATIGKFGVGFKAVFQYTATPHIYDPNIFFKIERFIVPVRLEVDYPGRQNNETLFVFPFDHNKRKPEEAFSDISEKLRSLDYPLLFVSSLKDIEFEISGVLGLYGKKVEKRLDFNETKAEYIRLTQNDGEDRKDLYDYTLWLFTRDDGNNHTYSVGFFINENGHLVPNPQNSQNAFCFFPTKEVTGLNFIIHAPFLLTDSREGIRAGVQHNLDMVSLLSQLAADCLVYLRDIGSAKTTPLIDDNIFDIVPYDESSFGDVSSKKTISFKPFYTAIKETFENEAIIPAESGFVATENAYWAFVPQIAELFSDDKLAVIAQNDNAQWVFRSFGRQDTLRKNKALTDYIDSITLVWLDESDILKGWSVEDGATYNGITASFIESQPIEWLHQFYKWIADTKGRTELIPTKPIFLNQNGKAAAAFDGKKHAILFLPIDGGSGYDTVNDTLLQNKDTVAFIKQIGIIEPSLRDEIYNIILKQYSDDGAIDTLQHFKKFLRYYQTCSKSDAKSFLDLVSEYNFILYTSSDDKIQYRGKPESLYFPFDPLPQWFKTKPETKFVSFDEYVKLVGEDKKEELVSFLTDIGVKDTPRLCLHTLTEAEAYKIKPSHEWPQPTYYNMSTRKWTEISIDGCAELVESIVAENNVDLSFLLWSQLLKFIKIGYLKSSHYWSQNNVLFGRYEYFYYSQNSKTFDSSEAIRLRTQPWLINVDGAFVSASELTVQTLNTQYDVTCDEALELFNILCIKDKFSEVIDSDVDITSYGEQLGLSEEEQKQAFLEYAQKKKVEEANDDFDIDGDDKVTDGEDEHASGNNDDDDPVISPPSIKRVGKEITKRATSEPKTRPAKESSSNEDAPADEDDYSKPSIDIDKKIEKVKEQAEREIQEIARLEDLKQQAEDAETYSYGWFKALLELESINSSENNANSREISISFAKVEHEAETSRTLTLKHPNR